MNKDSLKKHHFWVLSGLVPLLVLIAFVLAIGGVGGAIDAKGLEIETAKKSLTAKSQVKSDKLIGELDKQKAYLLKRQQELWQVNWEVQKPKLTWPLSPKLQALERQDIKFMALIPNTNQEYDEFTSGAYKDEYARLAESLAPTQFDGGWEKVLRFVNDWLGRRPDPKQLWLALEDLWVQRSMLSAVKAVNDRMADFALVGRAPGRDSKTQAEVVKSTFRSRIWEVELWVERRGTDQLLKGRLKNLTDRLQLMGVGNVLVLDVWLDKGPGVEPFKFKIGGEFVPAGGTLEVKENPKEHTVVGIPVKEIDRVRQEFDARTVPVRLVRKVHLNYVDARHSKEPLQPPEQLKDAEVVAPAAAVPGGPPASGSPGVTGDRPGMTPGGTGPGGQVFGGGADVNSVLMANKKRYIQVTPQVRRMPVAMAVTVDQAYVQDFEIALANMPLRFQITQTHWQRFRGALPATPGAAGADLTSGAAGEGGPVMRSGAVQQGFGGRPDDPYNTAPKLPPPLPPPGGAAPGTPGTPGPGGTSTTTVSEDQLTAGLLDVTVYGVVSLYEKYDQKEADAAAAAAGGLPAK